MVTKKISFGDLADDPDGRQRQGDGDDGQPNRQEGGHHRAEEGEQDDQRDGDPEALPLLQISRAQLVVLEGDAGVPTDEHAEVVRGVRFLDDVDDVLDVLRRLFQVAGEEEQHRRGAAVGGYQEVGGDQERAVGRVVVLSELHDAGPERRDLREHRLDLGLEGGVIDGQRRGLDDDHFAGRAGARGIPNLGALLHQIGRALRFVSAGQPELGRRRAGEQGLDDRQRDQYQQNPGGDREPRPACADAGQ